MNRRQFLIAAGLTTAATLIPDAILDASGDVEVVVGPAFGARRAVEYASGGMLEVVGVLANGYDPRSSMCELTLRRGLAGSPIASWLFNATSSMRYSPEPWNAIVVPARTKIALDYGGSDNVEVSMVLRGFRDRSYDSLKVVALPRSPCA